MFFVLDKVKSIRFVGGQTLILQKWCKVLLLYKVSQKKGGALKKVPSTIVNIILQNMKGGQV